MSIKLMAQIWELQLNKAEQSILLAMADHAKDDGSDCFPSVGRLAWKTDYSERQVQRTLHELTRRGVLTVMRQAGRGRATEYKINLSKVEPKPEYTPVKGDTMSPYQIKGDIVSPQRTKGDTMSPKDKERVTFGAIKGDILALKGDIAMSPQSLTINHKQDIHNQYSEFWARELEQLGPTLPLVAMSRLAGSVLTSDDEAHYRIVLAPHVTDGLDWLNQQAGVAIKRALSVSFGRRVNVEILLCQEEAISNG